MHYIPETEAEKHLGGNTIGGNPQTFYPELWAWMVKRLEVKSVLDVGCGEGHALAEFRRLGCEILGIDGALRNVHLANHKVGAAVVWDLTESYCPNRSDLAWCCEVMGQIEEQYVDNVIKTLVQGRYLALTHQLPGQQGYHIVNGHPPEYWIEKLKAAGMELDAALTAESKQYAGYYWAKTGMIFRRAKA